MQTTLLDPEAALLMLTAAFFSHRGNTTATQGIVPIILGCPYLCPSYSGGILLQCVSLSFETLPWLRSTNIHHPNGQGCKVGGRWYQ